METTKKQFELAESKMNELLALAAKKGGFEELAKKEKAALENIHK